MMRRDKAPTTAEISRLRQQKKAHVVRVALLCGIACILFGARVYFLPESQASSDEDAVFEEGTSQVESSFEIPSESEFAYFPGYGGSEDLDKELGIDANLAPDDTSSGEYAAVTEEEAQRRAEELLAETSETVNEASLESADDVQAEYLDDQLIISLAQGTDDEQIEKLMRDVSGYVVETLVEGDDTVGPVILAVIKDEQGFTHAQAEVLRHTCVLSASPNYRMDDDEETVSEQPSTGGAFVPVDETNVFADGTQVEPAVTEDSDEATDEGELVVTESDIEMSAINEELGVADDVQESTSSAASIEASSNDMSVTIGGTNDPQHSKKWEYTQLQFEEAWRYSKTDGKLTVAVIDTEFWTEQIDLKNMIVDTYNAVTGKAELTVPPETAPKDATSHGTSCAGIVAAEANNHFASAGISHNAALMLVECETLCANGEVKGGYDSDIIKGMEYVAKHANVKGKPPVRVISLSFGSFVEAGSAAQKRKISSFSPVLEKLNKLGIIVFCSAGNDGHNKENSIHYPSAFSTTFPNVVGIINLEQSGNTMKRRDTSNYNPSADTKKLVAQVAAPGTKIYTCGIYGTNNKRKTSIMRYGSGTSSATPTAAGMAALILAANPALTPKQVRAVMCQTATDLGPKGVDKEYGYGAINPVEALKKVTGYDYSKAAPAPDDKLTPRSTRDSILKNVRVSVDGKLLNEIHMFKSQPVISLDKPMPVAKPHTFSFKWSYPQNAITLETTEGEEKQIGTHKTPDGTVITDYKKTYKFTLTRKGDGPSAGFLNSYAFVCTTHELPAAKQVREKTKNASDIGSPSLPYVPPATTAPTVIPQSSSPTQTAETTTANPPKASAVNDPSTASGSTPSATTQPSSPPAAATVTSPPHARLVVAWSDQSQQPARSYQMRLPYLDADTPSDATAKALIAATNASGATVIPIRISHGIGKTAPTSDTVDTFFNSFVTSPNSVLESEVEDENTHEKWTIASAGSESGKDIAVPNVDGAIRFRTWKLTASNPEKNATASIRLLFWLPESEIAQSTVGTASSASIRDLGESIAWSNASLVLHTYEEDKIARIDMTKEDSVVLSMSETSTANRGIKAADAPFQMDDNGCALSDKVIGKFVTTDNGSTSYVDEYVYDVTITSPDVTAKELPKDSSGTAEAAAAQYAPISTTVKVMLQAPSEAPAESKKGDIQGQSASDAKNGDQFSALAELECWIGGKRYADFSYDKTDYQIEFAFDDPLPEPPSFKGFPEGSDWTAGKVKSTDMENGGTRHVITLSSENLAVSREYVFTYAKSGSPTELSAPDDAKDTQTISLTGFQDGSVEASDQSQEKSSKKLASTGGERLVQTGDAVVMALGTVITVASAAWLVANRKRVKV